MKIKIIGVIVVILGGVIGGVLGQNCDNFEKRCPEPQKSFKLSAASRSFSLKNGSKVTVAFNAMAGRDYFISICGKGKADGMQFKIVAGESGNSKILYDNAAVGFSPEKVITMASTQKIFVEVTAPKSKFDKGDIECGGIKIAYRNAM